MLHLHNNYSFTESLVETVIRSLRHSCRSELTRQGTSLGMLLPAGAGGLVISASLCMSPCSPDCIFICQADVRHTVSEDSKGSGPLAFPADCPHPSHCHPRSG